MTSGPIFIDEHPVSAMPAALAVDWRDLVGHGDEEYTWRLLTPDLQVIGELGTAERDQDGRVVAGAVGVTGGSVDLNVNSPTRGSGTMDWVGPVTAQPDWVDVQLQPWYSLTTWSGTKISWPLGVFLPSTPTTAYLDEGYVSLQVSFYDRTELLRRAALTYDPYGTNTTDPFHVFIREVLGFADLPAVVEETTKVPRTPMTFLPPSTYLQVVNGLADAGGYFAAWADGEGLIRVEGYAPPTSRPVAWTFADGDLASYKPDFRVEADWYSIPNHVIGWSTDTGDAPRLFAEAINMDPADPLSYPNRGPVVEVLEDIDVADQAALDAYVERALASRRGRSATVELEHFPVPIVPNDRADFRRDSHGLALPGVVQTVSINCTPGELWRTTLREVQA